MGEVYLLLDSNDKIVGAFERKDTHVPAGYRVVNWPVYDRLNELRNRLDKEKLKASALTKLTKEEINALKELGV